MSWTSGTASIATIIQGSSYFDSNNVDTLSWLKLMQGKAAYYAILRPGPSDQTQMTIQSKLMSWRTVVEVWHRYIDDASPAGLAVYAEDIVDRLNKYPTLGGIAVQAAVTSLGDMEEVERKSGTVSSLWARWNINVDWSEEKVITYA